MGSIVTLSCRYINDRLYDSQGAQSAHGESAILSQSYLRELKAFHRALGDVTRLRAVQILATEGELSVSELVARLHISQPLMSWHLRRLTRAGLVTTRRMGREVRCSFDRERYSELQERSFRTLMNRS